MDFPEADWKILRRVHAAALERFCERVLSECEAVLEDSAGSAHDRYLTLYRHMKGRDRSIAWAFDDMRRSRAMDRLVAMMALGVVTTDELAQFSPGVRQNAEGILAFRATSDP
jgi:hypothetical protein